MVEICCWLEKRGRRPLKRATFVLHVEGIVIVCKMELSKAGRMKMDVIMYTMVWCVDCEGLVFDQLIFR